MFPGIIYSITQSTSLVGQIILKIWPTMFSKTNLMGGKEEKNALPGIISICNFSVLMC